VASAKLVKTKMTKCTLDAGWAIGCLNSLLMNALELRQERSRRLSPNAKDFTNQRTRYAGIVDEAERGA
jgi:hypothetical protein